MARLFVMRDWQKERQRERRRVKTGGDREEQGREEKGEKVLKRNKEGESPHASLLSPFKHHCIPFLYISSHYCNLYLTCALLSFVSHSPPLFLCCSVPCSLRLSSSALCLHGSQRQTRFYKAARSLHTFLSRCKPLSCSLGGGFRRRAWPLCCSPSASGFLPVRSIPYSLIYSSIGYVISTLRFVFAFTLFLTLCSCSLTFSFCYYSESQAAHLPPPPPRFARRSTSTPSLKLKSSKSRIALGQDQHQHQAQHAAVPTQLPLHPHTTFFSTRSLSSSARKARAHPGSHARHNHPAGRPIISPPSFPMRLDSFDSLTHPKLAYPLSLSVPASAAASPLPSPSASTFNLNSPFTASSSFA